MMKIYKAMYCPCIHESGYITLSLHKTEEGAKKAMQVHKDEEKRKWNKMYKGKEKQYPELVFGKHENWEVGDDELLD